MNRGAVVTIVVAVLAMAGVIMAFVLNSSPYVTIAQAKTIQAERLHLAGNIVPKTLSTNARANKMSFDLRDDQGAVIRVNYTGPIPTNIREAKEVVAIGGVKGSAFESQQLLIKCPSKYESEKKS